MAVVANHTKGKKTEGGVKVRERESSITRCLYNMVDRDLGLFRAKARIRWVGYFGVHVDATFNTTLPTPGEDVIIAG